MRLGLIGATGWLGGALGQAVARAGVVAPGDLTVLNRRGPTQAYDAWPDVVWARDVAELVARSDAVILATRPEDFAGLDLRAPGRLVVSLMAGIGMARLAETGGRVVRAMPNAAAELGRSYTPWVAAEDVTEADRAFLRAVLGTIGGEDELGGEAQIEYLTGLSGSGAAYPALMAAVMLGHAREAGLSPRIAARAVEAVVCEGGALLAGRIDGAEDLVEAYRAYRGTTAAGLEAAETGGFRGAIRAALTAAAARAVAMGAPEPEAEPEPEPRRGGDGADVAIKALEAEDLPGALDGLAEVLWASVAAGASVGFILPHGREDSRAFWRAQVFPEVVAGGRIVLVAMAGARVVGTAQLILDLPRNQAHRGEVAKVLVHPEFRGRGIARRLMAALEARARERGKSLLTLDTRTGDVAEHLYRSLGFQVAGVIPGYCRAAEAERYDSTTYMFKALSEPV